jgi:hypothetical protein
MNTSKIKLIKSAHISYFPSGSAVELFNDVLYIVGDDASEILLLDKNYNPLNVEDKPVIKRISKDEKIDLEASTIIQKEGKPFLLMVGSGSKENREKVVMLPLPYSKNSLSDTTDNSAFIKLLKEKGIEDVNIEGVASTKQAIIFANRANIKNAINHLIFTASSFQDPATSSSITIRKLILPDKNIVTGISGLAYDSINDVLLFTASTEETANAYDDGKIGDSYVGYIKNISTQNKEEIMPDGFISLPKSNKLFKGEKIESVCIESVTGNTYTLHLVSDNDKGATGLFKINFTLSKE